MLQLIRTPLLLIGILLSLGSMSVAIPSTASAVNIFHDCASAAGQATDYCKDVAAQSGGNPVVKIIKTVINIVSYIGGAAAIIALVVSSLRLILSNGDASAVTNARNGILYSLIGVGVIVLAQAIVVFVLDKVK